MIRQANFDDLKELAKVHIACFPDSFSTQIGGKLLSKMYLVRKPNRKFNCHL